MRRFLAFVLTTSLVLALLPARGVPQSEPANKDKPTNKDKPVNKDKPKPLAVPTAPGYKVQRIHGFTLLINNAVFTNNTDSRWKRKPLDVLELELGTISRRLPDRDVQVLRSILIWVEWQDRADPDVKRGAVAKYYGVYGNVRLWSLAKHKHPKKANNIEIVNMRSLTREHQPGVKLERCVLLHEMAHAVHHRLFGNRNPAIQAAYKQAMARGLYTNARDVYGRIRKRPYASRNAREYFAELSCAYLDKLHYFPFTPDDLKKHDPQGYRLMELCWGKRALLDNALKVKNEREASLLLAQAHKLLEANKKEAGQAILKKIRDRFPKTKAGALARELLAGKSQATQEKKEPPKRTDTEKTKTGSGG
jgi:hypothetical protein